MTKYALLVLIGLMGNLVAGETLKIATVDMQLLFKDYHRTGIAQQQINVERARVQKQNNERLTRVRELDAQLQKFRKQLDDPSIADSRKREIYQEWQIMQNEGVALDRERKEFMQRRTQALNEKMVLRMKGILEEIRKLVEELAKKEDYDFVFDRSGLSTSQVPFLLYTKDATDITALLLESLNVNAPEKTESEATGTPINSKLSNEEGES